MLRRSILGLGLALILTSFAACTASDTKMERWAVKFTEPVIEVEAEDLFKEYSRDDETANDEYSGRRVLVTGKVFEVRDDDHFEPVVEFDIGQDEWSFQSLVAQFAEGHRSEVESWSKGDVVAVVCYIPVDDFGEIAFDSVTPLRICQPFAQ